MRLPRFRLRTLLVAVAIAGLVCGGEVMRQRRTTFLERAAYHARLEREDLESAAHFAFWARRLPPNEVMHRRLKGGSEDYHDYALDSSHTAEVNRRLRLKYERAARHPWLPVPPDPHEPQ